MLPHRHSVMAKRGVGGNRKVMTPRSARRGRVRPGGLKGGSTVRWSMWDSRLPCLHGRADQPERHGGRDRLAARGAGRDRREGAVLFGVLPQPTAGGGGRAGGASGPEYGPESSSVGPGGPCVATYQFTMRAGPRSGSIATEALDFAEPWVRPLWGTLRLVLLGLKFRRAFPRARWSIHRRDRVITHLYPFVGRAARPAPGR